MTTPTLTAYYKETDPKKRRELLEESITLGEQPEENAIRRELWELRYAEKSAAEAGALADGLLGLWMTLEFHRGAGHKMFGARGAKREIRKRLAKLHFEDFLDNVVRRDMLYRECVHVINLYMDLCAEDKSYATLLGGIISMKKNNVNDKIKKDIFQTAVELPAELELTELAVLTLAAREAYELHFPGEGGLPDLMEA